MVIRDEKIKFDKDEIENLRKFFDQVPFCGLIRCPDIGCYMCPFNEATNKIVIALDELDAILSARSNYTYDDEDGEESDEE